MNEQVKELLDRIIENTEQAHKARKKMLAADKENNFDLAATYRKEQHKYIALLPTIEEIKKVRKLLD